MSDSQSSPSSPNRRRVARDLIVFQVKLWLEGFKDVVLMPLSFGAAVIDVLFHRLTGGQAVYTIMQLGARFEEWVDLYGALDDDTDVPHTVQSMLDGIHAVPSDVESAASRSVGPSEGEKD